MNGLSERSRDRAPGLTAVAHVRVTRKARRDDAGNGLERCGRSRIHLRSMSASAATDPDRDGVPRDRVCEAEVANERAERAPLVRGMHALPRSSSSRWFTDAFEHTAAYLAQACGCAQGTSSVVIPQPGHRTRPSGARKWSFIPPMINVTQDPYWSASIPHPGAVEVPVVALVHVAPRR
jgi:hypothetical protein